MIVACARWKAQPVEMKREDHGYSLASAYYKCRVIRGVKHYKITQKGCWKIGERRLKMTTHNFLVYLAGRGTRLVDENRFENGDVR